MSVNLSTDTEELNDLQKMGWTLDNPERFDEILTLKEIQYSVLVYKLSFRRQTWSQIMQTFIPSLMLSLASASSLYINYNQLPARMGLAATSFLSLIALFKGSRYS